jgi:raffinose/stachyose/melibiose transport system permease protein
LVANKIKARAAFVVFTAPALILYLAFAIFPLFRGIWLSTTNWDGTAPWVPAQLPIERFEREILGRASEKNKAFILKYYVRDPDQGTYRKLELIGTDRDRMMRLFASIGYENPDMKNVGLRNYLDIFQGKVDARFFPETYKAYRFKTGDPLETATLIAAAEFEKNLRSHVRDAEESRYLAAAYEKTADGYRLNGRYLAPSELDQQIALSETPGLEDDWESLYNDVSAFGTENRSAEIEGRIALTPAIAAGRVSPEDAQKVRSVLAAAAEAGRLKGILSGHWYVLERKMGVLLFTAFFVVCNVILVNVFALLLALALDGRMRTTNALRAVFFIPNVLSMIIVAFIWQLIFTQLMPALTGVRQWMNNPELAPWITVFVAVWQGVGYYTVLYIAGLQSIPAELIECASLEGATSAQRFARVVFPLLLPAFTVCLFLSLASSLKTFDIIFALYPGTSTALGIDNITVNIFYDAFRDKHAGLATAKAVLLLLLIVIITGLQLIITKKREVDL